MLKVIVEVVFELDVFSLHDNYIKIHCKKQNRVQDESLRWLSANGKKDAVEKVVRKVARWNKVNYEDLKNIVDKRMATEQNTQKVDDKATTTENTQQGKLAVEKYSFVTILRNRRIFLISLIIWFTWYVQILEKVVV